MAPPLFLVNTTATLGHLYKLFMVDEDHPEHFVLQNALRPFLRRLLEAGQLEPVEDYAVEATLERVRDYHERHLDDNNLFGFGYYNITRPDSDDAVKIGDDPGEVAAIRYQARIANQRVALVFDGNANQIENRNPENTDLGQ